MGATRTLQRTDADYLELEAMLMAFVDYVRVTAFAIVSLLYADFAAGMVRAPMRVE